MKHYLKTSIRYLWNHKFFAVINLAGLATGLSVCFFAMQYVSFELSYDKFNSKYHKIYRLVTDVHTANVIDYQNSTEPMSATLKANFPEVKEATHIFLDYFLVQKDEANFAEEKVAYADSFFLSVFDYPLLYGDPKTALSAPFDLVLSESSARKYFGKTDVVGNSLLINGKIPARVTGVMKDMPPNSHLQVSILTSMSTLVKGFNPSIDGNWNYFGFYTYLVIDNQSQVNLLKQQLSGFASKHMKTENQAYTFSLEPLKDVYLKAKPRGSRTGSSESGNMGYLYIFALVSLFVLAISCINFVNLATAFSIERTKEISIRKVIGASRRQLFIQFMCDSILVAAFAFMLSFILCIVFAPIFNDLAGKQIGALFFSNYGYWALLLILALFVGFISGVYPALALSRFNPILGLKERIFAKAGGINLRKTLVVIQFSISIVVIISTIVIYSQLNFMQNKDLGFRKDHMLVIDYQFDDRVNTQYERFKQQLATVPGISAVSISSTVPGRANRKVVTKLENMQGQMQEVRWDSYGIDYDYLKQFEIGIAAGRGFSRDYGMDSTGGLILNETAVKSLGYKNSSEIIGKKYFMYGSEGRIIGVIKDFHFHSFHEEIQPLTMKVIPGRFTFLTLTIPSNKLGSTVTQLEKKWRQLLPGLPLSYFFADEAYNAQYVSEQRFGMLFTSLALVAILLSSLGLLGLSAYSISRRTKEIGVRKILGASGSRIAAALFADSLRPVLIAIIIASPLAWIAMNRWLENFHYRVGISWWVFVFAAIVGIVITGMSIGFHVFHAARANPVKSLRSE